MLIEPIKILFDIDGVLADFALAWTQTAVDMGMLEKPIKSVDRTSFDPSYLGLTHKQIRQVWSVVEGSRWWWMDKIHPMIQRSQIAELDELATFNETYFVTNRYGGHPNAQHQTHLWLKRIGIYNPNVITNKDKGKLSKSLDITHSIEDTLENALSISGKSFLLDRPYNQKGRKQFSASGYQLNVIKTIDEFFTELKKDGACGTNKN